MDDAALQDWMQTAEMRQAVSTLNEFSEKERAIDWAVSSKEVVQPTK